MQVDKKTEMKQVLDRVPPHPYEHNKMSGLCAFCGAPVGHKSHQGTFVLHNGVLVKQ